MNILIYIFIGGGLGSLSRFGISKLLMNNSNLPIATLSANVLSCIVMGLGLSFYKEQLSENEVLKSFLLIGFCGGFSTFSTFSLETFTLLKQGDLMWAIANIVVSVVLCVSILYFLVK